MPDPTAELTFDPFEPACVRCHTSMSLLEGCEWHDDPRLNLCRDCMPIVLETATDELTRLEPLPCPFCGEAPQTVGHVNIMVRCVTCMEPEAVTEGWMPLLRWNRRDELTRLRAELKTTMANCIAANKGAERNAWINTNLAKEVADLRAENERLTSVIHEIYLEVEGDVDGTPDASLVSMFANIVISYIPEHLRK